MYLAHVTYYLPSSIFSLSDLAQAGEFSDFEGRVFERMMGLKWVSRAPDFSVYDLARIAMQKFLKESLIDTGKINYFLFAHTADYVAPIEFNILQKLRKEFKLINAFCFSSTVNKCASVFQLIKLAQSIISDSENIVLLIADNAFTQLMQLIPGSTVLGDAATILLFNKTSNSNRFIDAIVETDGRFSSGSYAKRSEQLLFQEVYSKKVVSIIFQILSRHHLTMEEIKCIFPHNVNTLSWIQIAKFLSIDIEKIFLKNISQMGHCFGSDPFINLKEGVMQGVVFPGDYYLLVTVGLGATFSVMLFQY